MENIRPSVLRNKALGRLRGNWTEAAIAGLVLFAVLIISGGISQGRGGQLSVLGLAFNLFLGHFILIGGMFVFLDYLRGGPIVLKTFSEAFDDYTRYLGGILRIFIYTLLWTLLLVIPGIVKALSYGMTYYIMRENPGLGGEEAIRRSMAMMNGHKMELFLLLLSFIGWLILSLLTAGIGLIWLLPYMFTTQAAFYDEVKTDNRTGNLPV